MCLALCPRLRVLRGSGARLVQCDLELGHYGNGVPAPDIPGQRVFPF